MILRVFTVSDIHQSRAHYRWLTTAVETHNPDVVAIVGDCLDFTRNRYEFSIEDCANSLSGLPVKHLVFVRGNHEDRNWWNFVYAWPFEKRPLVALYGSAFQLGPLVIVGFPCHLGDEEPWCQTLPKTGNELSLDSSLSGRRELPHECKHWLPQLMRQLGPASRTLWLEHEPPMTTPIATPQTFNPEWTEAIERFRPLLVISGHDHETPKRFNAWHSKLGDTVCVNPGQSAAELHYCVLDFEFAGDEPALPRKITVAVFPWNSRTVIPPA